MDSTVLWLPCAPVTTTTHLLTGSVRLSGQLATQPAASPLGHVSVVSLRSLLSTYRRTRRHQGEKKGRLIKQEGEKNPNLGG